MTHRPNTVVSPHVPNYTLLEKLGEGGMGEVFLARQRETGARVAVKLVNVPADDPDGLRQRFDREVRLMVRFEHPHIVQVLDHGVSGGQPYLVLEYLEGGNLRGRMPVGHRVPAAEVRRIVGEIASALIALEEAGVVHRDLKPENILVSATGRVKVTDFGIAVAETEVGQLTRTAQTLGTYDYMAPEQRARLPVDGRADQYALAVIAYELLTGKRPVGSFKPVSQVNPQVHPDADAVLARALRDDPDERFESVRDFAAALDRALARRPRRIPTAAVATVGAAVLTAAAAVVYLWPPSTPEGSATDLVSPEVALPNPNPPAAPAPAPSRAAEANYFVNLGDQHQAVGRVREAESCYAEALRLTPNDPDVHARRALLYKKVELYQKALDDLNAALALDPARVTTWVGRGSVYVLLEDYARAIPDFDAALARDPRCAEALAWRGRAAYKLAGPDGANVGPDAPGLRDLDRAVELDPDCGTAYQFRALIRLAAKDYPRARDDLEHAVRCRPDSPPAHAKLSDFLANCPTPALRDPARAIAHARTACELTQWKGWNELRYLAKAHAAAGEPMQAAKCCEQALALAPEVKHADLRAQLDGYRRRIAPNRKSPP